MKTQIIKNPEEEPIQYVMKKVSQFQEVICRTKGMIEFPCVVCPLIEQCEQQSLKIVEWETAEVRYTDNTLILSLKFTFNDDVEKFIFTRFRISLSEENIPFVQVMREPEDPKFDISFFVARERVNSAEAKERLESFLMKLTRNFQQVIQHTKFQLNRIIRKETANLIRV